MAEGVRIQMVVPEGLAAALKRRATQEGRTVSNLGAFLLEVALRDQQVTLLGDRFRVTKPGTYHMQWERSLQFRLSRRSHGME